jgi:hypothetical protein
MASLCAGTAGIRRLKIELAGRNGGNVLYGDDGWASPAVKKNELLDR